MIAMRSATIPGRGSGVSPGRGRPAGWPPELGEPLVEIHGFGRTGRVSAHSITEP